MKKYILGALMLFAFMIMSCTDILDTKPFDKISGEQTWASENLTTSFVAQLYADVTGSGSWLAAYGSPNSCRSESITKNAMVGTLNSSFWSNDRAENMTKQSNYGWLSYSFLWRLHTALTKVAESPQLGDDFKIRLTGELYFLRAAHYFIYAKQFGGLQIIDRVLTLEDDLQIPRASIKETYDFILGDLDKAVANLPETAERGRVSKAAANALLMRVAIQAAAYVDGGTSNSSYYDRTIAAGVALGLDEVGSQLSPYGDLFSSYESASVASEQILTRERLKANTSLYTVPMQYQGLWNTGKYSVYAKEHFPISVTMNFWGMDGGSWPTQDLVDDYLVADVDGSLKYWEDASYIQTGSTVDEKMYFSTDKKRDLRFYATVLYDGCMYFNGQARIFFRRDGNCSNANSKINEGSEQEYGYKAGNLENYNSSTGYAMIKYHYDHIVSLPDPGAQKMDYCFSILRYGEAYLNMAEAYLMKGDFVNARKYMVPTMIIHGGFTKNKAEDYLSSMTGNTWGDPLFESYKRERNVEMVYENNDRYWSLLRWGMRTTGGVNNGEYVNNGYIIKDLQGTLRGIRISRDGTSYSFFEDNNAVGEARFSPKRYLLPVNESFRLKSGVTQNPGWD